MILLLLVLDRSSNEWDLKKKWMNLLGEINKNKKAIKLSIIRNQNNEDSLAMAVEIQRNRWRTTIGLLSKIRGRRWTLKRQPLMLLCFELLDSKASKTVCYSSNQLKAKEEGSVVLNQFNFRKKTNVVRK